MVAQAKTETRNERMELLFSLENRSREEWEPTRHPMLVTIVDISPILTTIRRHEALLRYARYLFIFNIAIFASVAIRQLARVGSFGELGGLIVSPGWQFAALVLGSVGATYFFLAHRLWWAFGLLGE